MRGLGKGRVALALLALVLLAMALRWRAGGPEPRHPRGGASSALIKADAAKLAAEEERVASTLWARERLAQQCGVVVEDFWDALNRSVDRLNVAASFPFETLSIPGFESAEELPCNIRVSQPAGRKDISRTEWTNLLEQARSRGWGILQVEFRHAAFDSTPSGKPLQSIFNFSAHLTNVSGAAAVLDGDLAVQWGKGTSALAPTQVQRVNAGQIRLSTRSGPAPFARIASERIQPLPGSFFVDPLILYDLDGDGSSEIILAAKNLVFRRRGNTYEPGPLCAHTPGLIFTGCIADFTGDGNPDFLCAKFEGIELYAGDAAGRFNDPGRLVWAASPRFKYVNVLAPADVDGDNDLDLFVAQYKMPYEGGAMPTPFYDANDGHPAYLLVNDGAGNFEDRTTSAGLGARRWRHTYSASFCDFDGDFLPDLAVVSDFAGLDLWKNEGGGHFREVTREWVQDSHAFGMGHAIADFDGDGRLDLLMLGMPSPTVDRLEHMGLRRAGDEEDPSRRARMSYGNRLYLARPEGGFQQTTMSDSIARSGWSWGCSALDVQNDGFPDVYIANGHETKATVREYEPHYWLHDIYVANSRDNPAVLAYFKDKLSKTRGRGQSYGGYDKNRLYLNLGGKEFFEAGHLFGTALEQDCRNVVSDDLDGDGRPDLLVTTFEAWPTNQQTLQIFRNTLEQTGNWIAFRFREEGAGRSPVGLRVTVDAGGRRTVRAVGLTDSYRAQHPCTARFGLGDRRQVERVHLRWPNGETLLLQNPVINQVHDVRLAQGSSGAATNR